MLTNKIFNASALMLSIKFIFAFYQTYFCLLSNVNMITTKYLRLIIRGCRCIK